MKARHLAFFALLAAGCSASQDLTSATNPGADAPGAAAGDGAGQPGARPGDADPGAEDVIAFDDVPPTAPVLSTLSCPDLAMPRAAASVYVDAAAKGAESGTKDAPFRTVAKALAHAGKHAVVWIAAGKYEEELVVPNKDVTLLGGFASGFGSRTNACATVLSAPNDYAPVLSATSGVERFAVEGISVTGGVRGLLFLGDEAKPSHVTIARCVFEKNGDEKAIGGAVFLESVNARIYRSVFRDNRASKGAALAVDGDVSLTIDQNLFERNLGHSDHGGGLYIDATSSKISHNTFRANATGVGIRGGWGGALIIYSERLTRPAKADLSFNVFTENVAGIGAAVFVDDGSTVTMSHDLVYRNRAYPENGSLRGAAIYVDGTGYAGGGSTLTAEYLTVVNNVYDDTGAVGTSSYGGSVYVEGFSKASFTNSIFWNNGENSFYVAPGNNVLRVDNSIGASECTSASNNGLVAATTASCKIGSGVFLPEAIYFGDEQDDDYHEKSTAGRFSKGIWVTDDVTSPAIDKADPSVAVGLEPLPNGSRANLGAFSQTDEASKSP